MSTTTIKFKFHIVILSKLVNLVVYINKLFQIYNSSIEPAPLISFVILGEPLYFTLPAPETETLSVFLAKIVADPAPEISMIVFLVFNF